MQVGRHRGGNPGGEWRTGEQYIGTCPGVGDSPAKAGLIPHTLYGGKRGIFGPRAQGAADGRLGSWWGKGLPSRRSVAGLRGRPATLGLRHGPDSYGRQQWGILDNGGNPDPAMPRAGRRPSGCKPLLSGKKSSGLILREDDGTRRISTG